MPVALSDPWSMTNRDQDLPPIDALRACSMVAADASCDVDAPETLSKVTPHIRPPGEADGDDVGAAVGERVGEGVGLGECRRRASASGDRTPIEPSGDAAPLQAASTALDASVLINPSRGIVIDTPYRLLAYATMPGGLCQ